MLKRKAILLACMPKSGSTYISKLLAQMSGFKHAHVLFRHNHVDLDKRSISRVMRFRSVVIQQHVQATAANRQLILKRGMKPVVLVRNLSDVLMSLLNHHEQNADGNLPAAYFGWNEADRLWHLIYSRLPWYFDFLASWAEASRGMPVHWISYRQFFADMAASMREILEFCDIPFSGSKLARLEESIAPEATRFNVGVPGRGLELSEAHNEAIRGLAGRWPVSAEIMRWLGVELDGSAPVIGVGKVAGAAAPPVYWRR